MHMQCITLVFSLSLMFISTVLLKMIEMFKIKKTFEFFKGFLLSFIIVRLALISDLRYIKEITKCAVVIV